MTSAHEKHIDQREGRHPVEEECVALDGAVSAKQPVDEEMRSLERLHPADLADRLETMPREAQVQTLETLPLEDAAAAVEEMQGHVRDGLLLEIEPQLAGQILTRMDPDDAADLLDELGEAHRDKLLRHVEGEDAAGLASLLSFSPDTAGGMMNPEIVMLDQHLTVDQAITVIRQEIEDKDVPYYAYLVDCDRRLCGVLSMRDLLTSRHGVILKDMVQSQNLVSVHSNVDREEVADRIRHYNFLAMPVVDAEGRLLGAVTHDDVIDVIHEEASEDMLGMVGAGIDETVHTPWRASVRKRLPWLLVNMANSGLSAWVVHLFQGSIAQMAILAVLMPMVANQAGNTGQQALAVMIRQLATERLDRKRLWLAVLREAKIGFFSGVLIGTIIWGLIVLLTGTGQLALVMSAALGLDMLIGAVAGSSIPLVLKEMGRDPAQASSIFLTLVTDSAGFFIFLGLATLFLF